MNWPAPGRQELDPCISVALPSWWMAPASPAWACWSSPRRPKFSLTRYSPLQPTSISRWGPRHDTYRACMPSRACAAVCLQPHVFASCRWIDLPPRCSGDLVQHASTTFAQAGRGLVVAWVDAFTPLIFRGSHPPPTTPTKQHQLDHRGEQKCVGAPWLGSPCGLTPSSGPG